MATIRLVPSTYTRSSTNRVTVSDAANMYYNTDHTANYCSIRGRNSSSNGPYYAFIHGFNFDDVPSNANVSAFAVKIRCYRSSNLATGSSYRLRLASTASSSSAIANTTMSSDVDTTSTVYSIPTGSLTWDTLSSYGSGFSIEVPLMSTNSSYPYLYVYGAEIEVTYTLPQARTVTSTLSGSGTISPSGGTSIYDGENYTLTITPTNMSDTLTVKNNGTDVTDQLVGGYTGGTQSSTSQTAASYTSSGSISSSSYISYPVGYTAESPHTYSSNVYASSNGSTAYVEYSFTFSSLPQDAVITEIEVKCSGQRENASNGPCEVTLYSGTTQKGTTQQFTSTSQQVITVTDPGTWTRTELQSAKLRWSIGYYGGRLYGITWKVTYTSGGSLTYYTYTYTVDGDATIAVTIGSSSSPTIYYKVNGSWVAATAVYKKVSGSWVLQSNLANVFDSNTNYVKG